jgi:hypothetical protein
MKLVVAVKLFGTKGGTALVSFRDAAKVARYKWSLSTKRYVRQCNGRKHLYLHRFILGLSDSKIVVDHVDGNPLNNCRQNLRVASNSQNQMNRRSNGGRKYKGVFYCDKKSWLNPWEARIGLNGRNFHLGRFASARAAAFAYDIFAKELFGDFARLNNVSMPTRMTNTN